MTELAAAARRGEDGHRPAVKEERAVEERHAEEDVERELHRRAARPERTNNRLVHALHQLTADPGVKGAKWSLDVQPLPVGLDYHRDPPVSDARRFCVDCLRSTVAGDDPLRCKRHGTSRQDRLAWKQTEAEPELTTEVSSPPLPDPEVLAALERRAVRMAQRIRLADTMSDVQRAKASRIGNEWAEQHGIGLPGERRGAKHREVGLYDETTDLVEVEGGDSYHADDAEPPSEPPEMRSYEVCDVSHCLGLAVANFTKNGTAMRLCARCDRYRRRHRGQLPTAKLNLRQAAKTGHDYLMP